MRYKRTMSDAPDTNAFIARWSDSGAAERANYQLFLSELCDLDDALLTRLVALNTQRAAEETNGQIRWLRPDFQNKSATPTQTAIDLSSSAPSTLNLEPSTFNRRQGPLAQGAPRPNAPPPPNPTRRCRPPHRHRPNPTLHPRKSRQDRRTPPNPRNPRPSERTAGREIWKLTGN